MLKPILMLTGLLVLGFSIVMATPLTDTGQETTGRRVVGKDAACQIYPPQWSRLDRYGNPVTGKDASWAMVWDETTGLTWERKDKTPGSIHLWAVRYTWQDAAGTFVARLNRDAFGGHTDWRLPTVRELTRLVDRDRYLPAVDREFFPFLDAQGYWTATPDAADPEKAWQVHLCRGYVSTEAKSRPLRVIAVRGPVDASADAVDNGDGTLTDPGTGLMWTRRAADGMTNWRDAVARCESLEFAGFEDWRLASVNELQSLVDYRSRGPALRAGFLSDAPTEALWTSTGYASNDKGAWLVDFRKGNLYHTRKDRLRGRRCVRGGQNRSSAGVQIDAPACGSCWKVGEEMPIRWRPAALEDARVHISLSRRGGRDGSFDELIAEETSDDGRFDWTVTGPAGVNCVVRVQRSGACGSRGSNGLFRIVAEAVGES